MTSDEMHADLTGHMVQLMERMSDLAEAQVVFQRVTGNAIAELTAAQKVTETRMVQVLEMHVQLGNIIKAHDRSIDDHEDRLDKLDGNV